MAQSKADLLKEIKKLQQEILDLEKNTANQVIKKVESAKLPPHAIKMMKDIDDRSEELKQIMKTLQK